MKHRDELIQALITRMQARAGEEDSLHLPGWSEASWNLLLADTEAMALNGGEVLVRQDDVGNDLYFLVEGELEVSIPQSGSMTMTPLVTVGPGSIVGEIAFLDGRSRSASVWSKGKSVLLRLPESAFGAFRVAEPALACDLLYAIARIMAQRLRRCMGAPKDGGREGEYF